MIEKQKVIVWKMDNGCERLVGIVKQDLLNHIIPLNEKHLHKLLFYYIASKESEQTFE